MAKPNISLKFFWTYHKQISKLDLGFLFSVEQIKQNSIILMHLYSTLLHLGNRRRPLLTIFMIILELFLKFLIKKLKSTNILLLFLFISLHLVQQ